MCDMFFYAHSFRLFLCVFAPLRDIFFYAKSQSCSMCLKCRSHLFFLCAFARHFFSRTIIPVVYLCLLLGKIMLSHGDTKRTKRKYKKHCKAINLECGFHFFQLSDLNNHFELIYCEQFDCLAEM